MYRYKIIVTENSSFPFWMTFYLSTPERINNRWTGRKDFSYPPSWSGHEGAIVGLR
jgi:hypothetical protein